MKSLIDLKSELKEGRVCNLNVFVGEENLIRKIYYQKIAEYNGKIKYVDDVKDLFKELEKKSLFKRNQTYVVYNDLEFIKQKESVFRRLIDLSKNNVVVLIYDLLPERDIFLKIFDEYITVFNYVTGDIAIKYVNKLNNRVPLDYAKNITFNCFNSYNNIVEEMNKYNHYLKAKNKDLIDDKTYSLLFNQRKEIPTTTEFANAFITGNKMYLAEYYQILKENETNILAYLPELYNTVLIFLYFQIYGKWQGSNKAYNAGEYWGRTKELRNLNTNYNKNDLLDIRYLVDKLDKDIRSGRMPTQYAWDWLIGVIL